MIIYMFLLLSFIQILSVSVPPLNNLETIQFMNSTQKQKKPLKIFLFLIENSEFLEKLKKNSPEELLKIIRDIDYFTYENRLFLLLPPLMVEINNGEISQKLLITYNRKALVAMALIVVSFDGTYLQTCFIPGDYKTITKSNLLFIIDDDKIYLEYGILSQWQQTRIRQKQQL